MEIVISSKDMRERALQAVRDIRAEPLMVVTIKEHKSTRSQDANRYYWAVVLKTISEHTGHTPEELHEAFKLKFLYRENLMILGEDVAVYPSTTKLKVKEFTEYLDKITQFAQHELECYLPSGDY